MTFWFTSDTHFSHKNILHLGAGRPFKDIGHHNEMLIKNWNERVMPDDMVFHLGDVALGPWPDGLDCVKRLNGYKILIPGNHDRISSVEKPERRGRFMEDYEGAFQEIWGECMTLVVPDLGMVRMSHYPHDEVFYGSKPDRYTDLRPADDGTVIVHGHTHTTERFSRTVKGRTPQIHVGVDSWDYAPVSAQTLVELLAQNT